MTMLAVQHKSAINSITVPGAITLTSTPTAGNVLVAFLGTNISFPGVTIGPGWTKVDEGISNDGAVVRSVTLMRIVQPGDTATLPVFATAGSTWWAYAIYEISGQYGTTVDDALLHVSTRAYADSVNTPLPTLPTFTDGSMGLTFLGSYNGSTSPSVSGSWTQTEGAFNNSLYGSIGAAHRRLDANDVINGSWSGGTSEPMSSSLVILRPADGQGFYPRHIYSIAASGSATGTRTVGWTPKPGNLLIAFLDWGNGTATSPTINAAAWTEYAHADRTTRMICALQRTVQVGDTNVIPALCSVGSGSHTVTIIEIDDPTASFADHINSVTGTQASGATMTTTSDLTTADNQMAIAHVASYNNTNYPTETTPWGKLQSQVNFGSYGGYATFFNFYPTSGATVQAAFGTLQAGSPSAYVQSIFQTAGPVVVPHEAAFKVNLIESGVPMSGVDLVPDTGYGWNGQIFTKNPTNNPITLADFNSMFVQVERTN